MSLDLANVATIYSNNPNLKKTDVETIFSWLTIQPHLPQLTELQVILFLHSCRYSQDETKVTIENYFTLKSNSDLFQSANENTIRRTLSSFFIGVLPKKTPEGYAILFTSMFDANPEKYVCEEHTKVIIMILCLYFHQHGPAELVIISDLKNSSFGLLFRLHVSTLKQILHFLEESAPTRIKAIHFVNIMPVTKHLLALIKPIMKKEVYESIKIHPRSVETLNEYIPRDCLPDEYGGVLGPLWKLHEENTINLIKNLNFFVWHDAQKVDETKRVKQNKNRTFFGRIQSFFRSSEIEGEVENTKK